jgi:hypothetical protein
VDVLWPHRGIDIRLFDSQTHPILEEIDGTPLILGSAHDTLATPTLPAFARAMPQTPWTAVGHRLSRALEPNTRYSLADLLDIAGEPLSSPLPHAALTWLCTNPKAVMTPVFLAPDGTPVPGEALATILSNQPYLHHGQPLTADSLFLFYETGAFP